MTRSPVPACGSGSGSSRRSPGACSRAVWMARLLRLFRWILQRRRENLEDHIGVARLSQQTRLIRLDQNVGQAGQDLKMGIVARGDADAHEDTIFTPVDARRELGERQGSRVDELPALVGSMGYREPLPDRGGHAALAFEHGIRVAAVHRPELLEDATRSEDRILLGAGRQTEAYRLGRQDVHAPAFTPRSPCRNAAPRRPG